MCSLVKCFIGDCELQRIEAAHTGQFDFCLSKPHHVKPHFLFRLGKILFHEYDAFNFVLLLVVICIIQRLFSHQIPFILLEVFVNLFVVLTF